MGLCNLSSLRAKVSLDLSKPTQCCSLIVQELYLAQGTPIRLAVVMVVVRVSSNVEPLSPGYNLIVPSKCH